MVKVEDQITIKEMVFHQGTNIGGKAGIVVSTRPCILVYLYDYLSNPVKCFTYEINITNSQELAQIEGDDPFGFLLMP